MMRKWGRIVPACVGAVVLAGCASLQSGSERPSIFEGLQRVERTDQTQGPQDGALTQPSEDQFEPSAPQLTADQTRIPSIARSDGSPVGPDDNIQPPDISVTTVDAVVPPLPLPTFVDVVFGEMLGVPYVTGPNVAGRQDVVQLRSSGEMPATAFLSLVSESLESYGLRVVPDNGMYRIVEDRALLAEMPRFITSRARMDTPAPLRPVVQFVPVSALTVSEMTNLLTQAFGRSNENLTIEANSQSNFVILSGLPDEVSAAVAMIDQLDELRYADTDLLNYSSDFWPAGDLADELTNVLRAEGWQAGTEVRTPRTILILPIVFSNELFIFTRTREAQSRVRFWLSQLDRPARRGDEDQLFVYNVRNIDATMLAEVVNGALQGRQRSSSAIEDETQTSRLGGDAVVADPIGNRLIYSGSASSYERLLPLMRQLDQAPSEVLIEVTIAEVQITDNMRSGVEFVIDSLGNSDVSGSVQSQGLGLGSGGLDVSLFSGNVQAAINAFADNRQVNVLSRPRLHARSGGSASIQVGSDIPILTSQRAADTQDGEGATDVLQSISYRQTGVLMQIEPIIFGDNRIDLTISQEVSTTLASGSSAISSPSISSRNISTTLSLYDGEMVLLGGLIQDNYTEEQRGIPFLKDAPGIGRLFSTEDLSVDRTELVVLITAYILRGPADRARFVDHVTDELSDTRLRAGDRSTLTRRSGFGDDPEN